MEVCWLEKSICGIETQTDQIAVISHIQMQVCQIENPMGGVQLFIANTDRPNIFTGH